MLSSKFRPWQVPVFLAKYAYLSAIRKPILVHFEVTLRCNARCSFCDYWKAGIDQFNISLDYLDERHDRARGIPGLTRKIFDVIPRMRAIGIDSIRFNTVIKESNLDQILPIAERAREL